MLKLQDVIISNLTDGLKSYLRRRRLCLVKSGQMSALKDLIISNLTEISNEEVPFKRKYYNIAISKINNMDNNELVNREKFDDIDGIGKKINDKIIQIRTTRTNLARVNDIILEKESKFDMTKIYGVGFKLREKIEAKYGKVKDVQELIELNNKHNFLNKKHMIGLKHFEDILLRIPRAEMAGHDDFISDIIGQGNIDVKCEITGSYRRKNTTSGDIDILVTSTGENYIAKYKQFVDELIRIGYISDILAYGDNKFMGMCILPGCKNYRRLDIIVTTPDQHYFELLYFTGNDEFNKQMRSYALEKGFSLSQYSFTDLKTKLNVTASFDSECDIFNFLDLSYVEPENRVSGAIIPIPSC